MSLSPEFEARRSEACEKIEQIVEEYRDVFGPHESDESEIPAAGSWALLGWIVALDYKLLDETIERDEGSEFMRTVSPRHVSYTQRVGLLYAALDATL